MRLELIASNALNQNRTLPAERVARIARRFFLAFCAYTNAWHPEDECVTLENGRTCHESQAVAYGGEYYSYCSTESCPECHDRFPEYQGHRVRVNRRNSFWCTPCYENESFCCENCNETVSNEYRADYEDAALCDDCAAETVQCIPAWHQATRPRLPSGKEEFPFWSLELELELNSEDERRDFLEEVKALNISKLIWEKDGSLCHAKGIELIFCYYETKELLLCDLSRICQIAKSYGGLSWQLKKKRDRWAGCHINRNRAGWTEKEIARLIYLIERNKSLLIRLAGRECDIYSPFSNPVLYGAKRRLQALARGHQGKYAALNVSSFGRIEWRLFSGSLKPRRLEAYLNTVEALERLAKGKALHALAKLGAEVIQKQIELVETK
jgi:hypothetical protein